MWKYYNITFLFGKVQIQIIEKEFKYFQIQM